MPEPLEHTPGRPDHPGASVADRAAEARPAALLAAIIDSSDDAIISKSLDGIITSWNGGAERIFGYPAAEVIGKSITLIIPADRRSEEDQILAKLRRGERIDHFETIRQAKDGRRFAVSVTVSPVRDGGGRIIGASKVARDISERKAAEAALLAQKERLALALAAGKMGAWEWDPATGATTWSPELIDLLHVPAGYAGSLEQWAWDHIHPEDQQALRHIHEAGTNTPGDLEFEFRFLLDGEEHWMLLRGRMGHALDGRPRMVGVTVDVTQRKRHEAELALYRTRLEAILEQRTSELAHAHAELRAKERLAALGNLSAGIGHDIGNLLLPIRLRVDSLRADPSRESLRPDLDAIASSVTYLQRLSNSLKLFAADPDRQWDPRQRTHIHEWWPDFRPLLRSAIPQQAQLIEDFPGIKDLPPVAVPPEQLAQAVFNLVQNAGDALSEGRQGKGTVRASARARADRGSLSISVSDDGPGMSPEVLRRCQEPFFSTKGRRISTGMGLPMVRGFAEKAGGWLHIESTPGRGTTITIEIPAASELPAQTGPRPSAAVTVMDPRSRAYAFLTLRSLGVDARVQPPGPAPDADLWVVDSTPETRRAVRSFIERPGQEPRAARRVLILGDPESSDDETPSNVSYARQPRDAASLRAAIQDAVGGMVERPLPH